MSAALKYAEPIDIAKKLEALAKAIHARCAIDDQFVGFLNYAAEEMKAAKRRTRGAKRK